MIFYRNLRKIAIYQIAKIDLKTDFDDWFL